ncbi:hypothetical protein JL107_08075 [Nakamurella flavida]|uniref:DUF2530 domain-containing protein n=1 Tax=Nakamurella flavida TaxID=363630 RepID=A0A938YJP9_9ACTN|nr:hypothetical protein [Nakamurella flavida]MBM9476394.1 hypothetical protein [Nakamurella flavida]MDP9779505.1 membrane protein YdbS with pleckstrin-like domain [Nakamurella flavida]
MTTKPPRYSENEEKRLTAMAVANLAIGVLWILLYVLGSSAWWQLAAAVVFLGLGVVLLVDINRQRAKRTQL